MARRPPLSGPQLELALAYESGTLQPPAPRRTMFGNILHCGGRFVRKRYQRSPDPSLSRLRRKQLADRPALPPQIRLWLTESERAYAQLVRERHIEKGYFDLCHDEAAARIGCCAKTVKRSQDRLEALRLISVELQPQNGRKHLPNIVKIISNEWLVWIDHDPRAARAAKAAPTSSLGDINVKPRNPVDKRKLFANDVPPKPRSLDTATHRRRL